MHIASVGVVHQVKQLGGPCQIGAASGTWPHRCNIFPLSSRQLLLGYRSKDILLSIMIFNVLFATLLSVIILFIVVSPCMHRLILAQTSVLGQQQYAVLSVKQDMSCAKQTILSYPFPSGQCVKMADYMGKRLVIFYRSQRSH